METTQEHDRSLFVSCKLPLSLKKRLDSATIGDSATYTKTGLIRYLLTQYFHAKDTGRNTISLAMD